MSAISVIENSPPEIKAQNYVVGNNPILKENRFLLSLRTLCGVNSGYLISNKKILNILSNLYCFLLGSGVIIINITYILYGNPAVIYFSVKLSLLFCYTIFNIGSLISNKKKLKKYFEKLISFDENLNIKDHLSVTTSMQNINAISTAILLTNCVLIYGSFFAIIKQYSFIWYMDMVLLYGGYNLEQIFYLNMIRMVYKRVLVLKGHSRKLFCLEDGEGCVEMLASKKHLDTASLYQAYDLLHQCCLLVNRVMSLPVLAIFLTSGLTAITILSRIIIDSSGENSSWTFFGNPSVFFLINIFYCTILLVIPCYYASLTGSEVSVIRRCVHDAICTQPLEKLERRRAKALLELTKASRFEYALFGVIDLNMSLPLSYMSLCTAYLFIFIQFSKALG